MAHRMCRTLVMAAALAISNAAVAEDSAERRPFSLELRTGAEYDSNVAVLDLDTSSGESDVAALVDFHLGLDEDPAKRLRFNLAYDFSQSLHQEFEAFDLRIHRGSAGLGYDFGGVTAGVTYQYADAALGGDGYLVLKQASPYLSKLFGKRLFLRLAWMRTDKEFTTSPQRDATADAPAIDAFVFLDGVKRYLVFGYEHVDEEAADAQFDYSGTKLKAHLTRRFTAGARQATVKAGLRHESRSYAPVFLSLAPPREDDRDRFEAELEVSLSKRTFLRARYEYASNRSNLSAVDFQEHVASIAFGLKR